jgi:predicted phosphodiesterase
MGEIGGHEQTVNIINKEHLLVSKTQVKNLKFVYTVTREGGETIELHQSKHNAGGCRPSPGYIYLFEELELVTTNHKKYFRLCSESSINKIETTIDFDSLPSFAEDAQPAREFEVLITGDTKTSESCRSTPAELQSNKEIDIRQYEEVEGYDVSLDRGHRYRLEDVIPVEGEDRVWLLCRPRTTIEQLSDTEDQIRFLIISDTHIGIQHRDHPPSSSNCLAAFDRIVNYAIEKPIDGIIHAGDVFDNDAGAQAQLSQVKYCINRLAQNEIWFAFISGNHDPNHAVEELQQLENVMHIGDRKNRILEEFAVIGYDYGCLESAENYESRTNPRETLLFAHPDHQHRDEIINNLNDSQRHLFFGHNHQSQIESINGGVHYPGTPASISSVEKPSIIEFRGANGITRDIRLLRL